MSRAQPARRSAALMIEKAQGEIGLASTGRAQQKNAMAIDGDATAMNDSLLSHLAQPECGR
jgi:hypothetical protein